MKIIKNVSAILCAITAVGALILFLTGNALFGLFLSYFAGGFLVYAVVDGKT